MSNLPQGSKAPVDLISQLQCNINSHILRDFHLRDVWWGPENQRRRKLENLQNFAHHGNQSRLCSRMGSWQSEQAPFRNRFSFIWTLGIPKAHLLMKVEALDHRNRMASERMRQWHTKVRKWYSITSNRSQMAVAPASTPPEIFLFLHRTRSAAASAFVYK